jgi:HEAT repeat protein
LFYVTLGVTLLILVSTPLWPTAIEQWTAWGLSRQLRASDEATQIAAADGLVQLGPAAASWVLSALRDPDPKVRERACSIVARTVTGRPDAAVLALVVSLGDGDASVRSAAAAQLGSVLSSVAPPSAPARSRGVEALGAALRDVAEPVRSAAVWALWSLGPAARPAAGELERALDGPDRSLRIIAGMALQRIDPAGTRARVLQALEALVSDPNIRMQRFRLFQALREVEGPEDTAARFIALLKDPDAKKRGTAIWDLTNFCSDAAALKPALIDALASPDGTVRCEAALFLAKHEPRVAARATDVVVSHILDPIDGSYIGPELVRRIREAGPSTGARVAQALVDRLPAATKATNRVNVFQALGETGPEGKTAVATLLEASKVQDRQERVEAVNALVKIDPAAAATRIPVLVEWMARTENTASRLGAIGCLRDLGPAAAGAVPALLEAADEDHLEISTAAIEALSRIDPPRAAAIKQSIEQGVPRR